MRQTCVKKNVLQQNLLVKTQTLHYPFGYWTLDIDYWTLINIFLLDAQTSPE